MMADDGGARPKEDGKLFGKHKWRGKMFSKAESQSKQTKDEGGMNEDVMDFLRPTAATNAPRPPTGNPSVNLGRIDVQKASRWPAAADVGGHNGNQTPARLGPYDRTGQRPGSSDNSYKSRDSVGRSPIQKEELHQTTSLRRPRKNKNLTVGFSSRPPEVIGEGGDEAELPAQDVAKSRSMPRSPARGPSDYDGQAEHPGNDPAESLQRTQQEQFKPLPVRRRPTGLDEVTAGAEGARNMADCDSDDDQSPIPGTAPDASLDHKSTGLAMSFIDKVRAKMQLEEGKALHQGAMIQPPADAGLGDYGNLPPKYVQDASRSDHGDEPAPSPSYSLRPIPSPLSNPTGYPFPTSPSQRQISEPQPRVNQAQAPAPAYHKQNSSSSPHSLLSAATAVGDGALDDFSNRVSHYSPIFHLAAESVKPIAETPFQEWIRTSTWWFLKGRSDLETAMRVRGPIQGPRVPLQAYVDLAKSWWILQQILPQHPEARKYGNAPMSQLIHIARQYQDVVLADSIEMHQALVTNLRGLTMSMKRNDILPPLQEQSQLAPGLDTSIWIKYPFFTPEVCSQLSGTSSQSLVLQAPKKDSAVKDDMPLGDSKDNFSYGRFFVDVYISDETNTEQEFCLPCLISIVRERTDWLVNAILTSQNALVNLRIQVDGKSGLTWNEVRWRSRQNSLQIDLKRGLSLTVQFSERDYQSCWKIYDYSNKVEESLQPEPGEILLLEHTLKSFRYMDPDPRSKAFPLEAVPRCRMRLFENKITISEGTGSRKVHRGYRLVVITSPKVKTLGRVSQSFDGGKCVQFGFLRGEDGGPALLLQADILKGTMILSFHDLADRTLLQSLLTAAAVQGQETVFADLPLKSLTIEQNSQAEGLSQSGKEVFGGLEWQQIQVINQDADPDRDFSKTVLSNELRVVASAKVATVTDRMSLGPGQLQIRLEVGRDAGIKVLRSPQEDMTISVAEGQGKKDLPDTLSAALEMIRNKDTIRSFTFNALKDLHSFQSAITGFTVLFDGMASSFAIARRRMVVPLYKKWDSNMSRLQVIKQEKVTQFIAFFADFSHGYCMNFVLKGTDIFESFGRSGKFCIRFVDAKFPLPKGNEDTGNRFVCLDMPEYPAEHDDITIAFDSEEERDHFQEALPAPTKPVSRMPSLRK